MNLQSVGIGIITFFGIFVPGAYLAGLSILAYACALEFYCTVTGNIVNGHKEVFNYFTNEINILLSLPILIAHAYLLGVGNHIVSPDWIDYLSTKFLKCFFWIDDRSNLNKNLLIFKITNSSIIKLRLTKEVPDNVLEKLENILKNKVKKVKGEDNFLKLLDKTIGEELTQKYKSLILKHAKCSFCLEYCYIFLKHPYILLQLVIKCITKSIIKLYQLYDIKETFEEDKFPYTNLEWDKKEKITSLLSRLNEDYDNKDFFNYCKLAVITNNEYLAKQIRSSEALIRFLSGTAHVMMISFVVGLLAFVCYFSFILHPPIVFTMEEYSDLIADTDVEKILRPYKTLYYPSYLHLNDNTKKKSSVQKEGDKMIYISFYRIPKDKKDKMKKEALEKIKEIEKNVHRPPRHWIFACIFYFGLILISILIFSDILLRFKYQRRKEVYVVWESIYLLSKGGAKNELKNPYKFMNGITLS